MFINIGVTLVAAIRVPGYATAWSVVVALAILVGVLWGRVQALTAQDRVIRLEETLRLHAILPPDLRHEIANLSRSDFVALRFASDAEVPELVRRVRAGEFAKPGDIKRAVRDWRADHLRV